MPLIMAVPVTLDRCGTHDLGQTSPPREDRAPGPVRALIVLAAASRPRQRAIAGDLGRHRRIRCASGGAGSRTAAWKGSGTCPGPGGPGRSPPQHPGRGGRAGLPAARRHRGADRPLDRPGPAQGTDRGPGSSRSRRRRCCGSWLSTPSSRGSTSRGSTPATRTSKPRPGSSWTSTKAGTAASRCAPATGSCPSTQNPRSTPAAACTAPCPPDAASGSATSTNTSAKAPSRC